MPGDSMLAACVLLEEQVKSSRAHAFYDQMQKEILIYLQACPVEREGKRYA